MKKALKVLMLVFTLVAVTIPFTVYAAEITTDSTVVLEKGKTTGTTKISVKNEEQFAGCEFKVSCGEGVKITSINYSVNASKAGPTTVDSYTYFSFFSGTNTFSGEITATVKFEYVGQKDTQIKLETVKVYTINEVNPDADIKDIGKTIKISVDHSDSSSSSGESQPSESSSSSQDDTSSGSSSSQDDTSSGNSSSQDDVSSGSSSSSTNDSSGLLNNTSTTQSGKSSDAVKTGQVFPLAIFMAVFISAFFVVILIEKKKNINES